MTAAEIRARYMNAGFSRRSFAAHIDVPEGTIRRLENGQSIHPESAKKVADWLDVLVTDLMPIEDVQAA